MYLMSRGKKAIEPSTAGPKTQWWNNNTSLHNPEFNLQHCDSLLPRAITVSSQTTLAVQPSWMPNKLRHEMKSGRNNVSL